MKKKLIGKILRERFHLIDTDHFQFIPVEKKNFSARSEEKHSLLTCILHLKIANGILIGKSKTMTAFIQRIIIYQCVIAFLKPYFIIFVIEYDATILLGDCKR